MSFSDHGSPHRALPDIDRLAALLGRPQPLNAADLADARRALERARPVSAAGKVQAVMDELTVDAVYAYRLVDRLS